MGRKKPLKKTAARSEIIESCTAWLSDCDISEMKKPSPSEATVTSSRVKKKAQKLPKNGTPSTRMSAVRMPPSANPRMI